MEVCDYLVSESIVAGPFSLILPISVHLIYREFKDYGAGIVFTELFYPEDGATTSAPIALETTHKTTRLL